MKHARWLLLALLPASTLAASPAGAWTWGDTLTTIYRPLPNLPAFARPGDPVTVWANASPGVSGWSASLRFGDLQLPMTPAGGGWQPAKGRWELSFLVPNFAPEEVYDLQLVSNGTLPDIAQHAVKVIPDYRADYYFAQVSDTHLPSHAFSDGGGFSTADTSAMPDFAAVIADLNVISPEFVLHTGDLVNEGELEDYLAMFELSRAQQMLSRLHAPIFVISGNHDIGGWKPTPPPDGTARKNWWRVFGWPFLGDPPAGDPSHSQNFSFDYGPLHVIGLESYINHGSYDSYRPEIWGAQSMSSEQMSWLAADVAQPHLAGHTRLAFTHYDFGGTQPNGQPSTNPQFANPAGLGLDGFIWGHFHGVPEGNRTAKPFNLGLQAVIDGRRTFRIFRVSNGVISPGPMHHSGGSGSTPIDSLAVTWSAANDGTRSRLTANVVNRYGEGWEHARLRFVMIDHDSSYAATGGIVTQTIRHGGRINVYVKCPLGPLSTAVVSVAPVAPLPPVAVDPAGTAPEPWLECASLYRPAGGPLTLRFGLPREGAAEVEILDVTGRRVARLFEGGGHAAEPHSLTWTGADSQGNAVPAGLYFVRLETDRGARTRKLLLLR